MLVLDLSGLSMFQLSLLLALVFALTILVLLALLSYLRRTRVAREVAEKTQAALESEDRDAQRIVLVRQGAVGRLQIEVGGERFATLAQIPDSALRRSVVRAAADLARFTGLVQPPIVGDATDDEWRDELRGGRVEQNSKTDLPPEPASVILESREGQAAAEVQIVPAEELAQEAFMAQLAAANMAPEHAPRKSLASLLPRAVRPDRGSAFVVQIERILQRKVREGNLGKPVHIRVDGQGVLRVESDGILYESPGDVPDPAVRDMIRDAVGEWETSGG